MSKNIRIGDCTHQAHVFKRHMRAAVEILTDARLAADDVDAFVRISDGQEYLVEGAPCDKCGEAVYKGLEAQKRKPAAAPIILLSCMPQLITRSG